MAYRYQGRAETNPDNPHAHAICDRCGFRYNLKDLVWQYEWEGGSTPINKHILVCTRTCLDVLNFQFALQILPPDPPPLYNVRPETFALDEDSDLSTQGILGTNPVLTGDPITTQSGDNITTAPLPDPFDGANAAYLVTRIAAPGGSVAVAYLDLFNGDPGAGGVSQLLTITGSATRTNIASQLSTTLANVAENTNPIIVSTASLAGANVNFVGIYDAASSGTLLMSGPCSVNGWPPVVLNAAVVFDSLGISITLS